MAVVLAPNEVQLVHTVSDEDYKGQNKNEVVIYTEIVQWSIQGFKSCSGGNYSRISPRF